MTKSLNHLLVRKACREYQNAVKKIRKLQNNRFQSKLRNLKVTDTHTYWKLINGKPAVKSKPRIADLEQHFRNLNVTINDNAPAYATNINRTDYDDLILNGPITEEEITAASKK